jgi:rare lipoprotein A
MGESRVEVFPGSLPLWVAPRPPGPAAASCAAARLLPPPPKHRCAQSSTAIEPGEPGFFDSTRGKPVFIETGDATWYYSHAGRHADGNTYPGDAPTAAHKTLPLGTTVRVTNLTNGEQTLVRITDRGPFVRGRVLDLSVGAAKQIGLYRMGMAKVRIEAFPHNSADPGGRWAVQTGPFKAEGDALDLKSALMQRYRGARVAEFRGDTGFWVRIDPANHAYDDAQKIEDWIGNPDPVAAPFIVRID